MYDIVYICVGRWVGVYVYVCAWIGMEEMSLFKTMATCVNNYNHSQNEEEAVQEGLTR